ncbi:MAG TPA: family 10 glycosylhydrolase [Telluria sp.]|nr:family 10 glycosylhydrolase [Telluria sp.]
MKRRAFALAGLAGAAALLTSCATPPVAPQAGVPAAAGDLPPEAPREFRAAWVSTVANIDWPSRPGLPAAQQQAEAIAILDRARGLNLNALILQVRPAADAVYASKIEPWSEYLSGTQGQAPQPWYDPLKFWVREAHARGLELHAWFNPYRARHSAAKSPLAREHVANTQPAIVKQVGKYLWMDPGEEAAVRQSLEVVLDVVRRYDIDGVHIDDYFYPYPEGEPEQDFPDGPSWARYQAGGGTLDRASWRRENVNRMIEALHTGIHKEKPWVRFGVSPFGIGRPDRRPSTVTGFSQYDKLYADAETWLANGWLDYFAPQLYWAINQPGQEYVTLLDYWIGQNTHNRHLWPGLFTSRIGAPTKDYPPEEIVEQIGRTRQRAGADGHIHFSMIALMENRKGIADQLRTLMYAAPALVPATPWLAEGTPAAPRALAHRDRQGIALKLAGGPLVTHFALWARYGNEWRFSVAPAAHGTVGVPDDARLGRASAIFVSAVDRVGMESPRVPVTLP